MYAYVEEPTRARCDSTVQSLSWMGKAPDGQPEGGTAWRLSETSYYEDGWLASGNTRGVVGVTMTACSCRGNSGLNTSDQPARTNFNLRGHRSEVILVRWNEPYQKLATCDVTGIIFVWIKHDGRWSIELINDRSSQVTDFAWSHDGQMALICYKDSFVLVGSVAGQRYWSSMLNLDGCLVTCGIWSPDDQKVMFGTTAGKVIVMSAGGTMVAQVIIHEGLEITYLGWSSERFYLVDRDADNQTNGDDSPFAGDNKPFILSVSLAIGDVLLMSNYDDVCPKVIHTGLAGVKMEWSNDGELLAIAGHVRLPNQDFRNELRFYRRSTRLQMSLVLPSQFKQPVSALTWGHNDRRVFIAIGCDILTVCVLKRVASLQLLCGRRIQQRLADELLIHQLPLPNKLQSAIGELFMPTIKGYIPHPGRLREFVCTPPPRKERLHCTIIRHGDDTSGGYYTLYLEYLGGLIPLLKGKRASKLHPDFVIFDPQMKSIPHRIDDETNLCNGNGEGGCDDSDTDVILMNRGGCGGNEASGSGSPGIQRRKRLCKLRDSLKCRDMVDADRSTPDGDNMYSDNLPEVTRLVEITSNIWGTKFRFTGLVSFLPDDLGSVTYKTSLLHLQPRQMTVTIFELTSDLRPQTHDPNYNPNQFSESEDEPYAIGYEFDTQLIDVDPHSKSSGGDLHGVQSGIAIDCQSADRSPKHGLTSHGSPANPSLTPSLVATGVSACSSRCHRPECMILYDASSSPSHSGICESSCHAAAKVSPTEPGPFLILPFGAGLMGNGLPSMSSTSSMCCGNRLSKSAIDLQDSLTTNLTYIPRAVDDVVTLTVLQNGRDCTVIVPPDSSTSSGISSSGSVTTLPRWADRACEEIQYIDDDCDDKMDIYERQCSARDAIHCTAARLSAREIMQSTQMLASTVDPPSHHSVVQIVRKAVSEPAPERGVAHTSPICTEFSVRRQRQSSPDASCFTCGNATELVITAISSNGRSSRSFSPTVRKSRSPGAEFRHQTAKLREMARSALCRGRSSETVHRRNGKRRGLCGVAGPSLLLSSSGDDAKSSDTSPHASNPSSPAAMHRPLSQRCGSLDVRHCDGCNSADAQLLLQSASLPASPIHRPVAVATRQAAVATPLFGRSRLQSPLAARRRLGNNNNNNVNGGNMTTGNVADSSDDEFVALNMDEITTSENYRNLETFQKAQLNKKLRKVRTKCDSDSHGNVTSRDQLLTPASVGLSPRHSPQHGAPSSNGGAHRGGGSPAARRRFVMYNKAPMWNETSQVYQLDFGGRVTQESAKNFQIEFGGKQVMQFGRIDNNAYTLDFQYPYSAIQAFAVALANVTQRLK